MKKIVLLLLILLVFLVCGCGPRDVPSPTGTAAVLVEDTASQTETTTPTEVPPTGTPTQIPPTPTDVATATVTATATATANPLGNYPAEGYGPLHFPKHINPLTGLPVADSSLLDRRPIAVKISNGPRSVRPQWGLSFADHVYEYYHEGWRTRFNAIFYGQDAPTAGPIRSARFADEHIFRMYKSFFAYGSADARVLWRIFDTGLGKRFASISDAACPPTVDFPLCRTDPNGYNHLITNTAVLSEHFTEKHVDNSRQNLDGLYFQADAPEDGFIAGNSVTIRYSQGFYNRWDYDPAYGKYVRYQDVLDDSTGGSGETFEALTDKLTGEPIRADNVVVIFAAHNAYSLNPEMWEINLISYGKAYLFRDGRAYEINWGRTGEDELIRFVNSDGNPFPLRPGNTWFQIIGTSSSLTNDGANWRFEHVTP
ncbi:MAG: DUF3048 C-terminal domain-containing protein [Anaerolineales bacterium]|nr:DUF3048 C-terminal domain-containing protein [Chloroflexota bacterium]MBL6980767.1 DUF3048 C-terminal domain-containing protein [Anaerolineales bacterium]